jgi:hypothetical protein
MPHSRADDDRAGGVLDAASRPGFTTEEEVHAMRRRIATLAAMSVFALALSAAPALAGSPAIHLSWDAASNNPPIHCGPNTYTITSGNIDAVMHEGASASGNLTFAETVRPSNVVVQDQNLVSYRTVGAEHFGGTINIKTGQSQDITVFKLRVVGTGDSLNIILRTMPNGDFRSFGPGTCSLD